MSKKSTPGPWRLGPTEGIGRRGLLYVVDADGNLIADCEAPRVPSDDLKFIRSSREDEANARLISASPELLAALRMYVDEDNHADVCDGPNDCTAVCRATREAIARATGGQP